MDLVDPNSLLINTTYYPRNAPSRQSFSPQRRAHFGDPIRESPYTAWHHFRGARARESVPNWPRGGFRWPATRIRQVATLSPARRAISENARGRPNRFCVCAFAFGRHFFRNRRFCACGRLIASTYARLISGPFSVSGALGILAPGQSRHSMRVRSRTRIAPNCGFHSFHRPIAP